MENLLISFVSAFIGTFIGAALHIAYGEHKKKTIRNIAFTALNLFQKYAKDGKCYNVVAEDFNNAFNLSEKRAILVLLHKLGVPISIPLSGFFNIKQVSFLENIIIKEELNNMKQQIESGNCDNQFFLDVESYFNNELLVKTQRNIIIKYIDTVMAKSTLNKEEKIITFPEKWYESFSPGEFIVFSVFRNKNLESWYYNEDNTANMERIDELKREVNIGLWDEYFKWDSEAYGNLVAQRNVANVIVETIRNSFQQTKSIESQNDSINNIDELRTTENK